MAELGQKGNRNRVAAGLILAATVALWPTSAANQSVPAPRAASAAFARLKQLVGEWQARAPKVYGNSAIRLQYRLISDESVLVETFTIDDQSVEMVTMYHLDGERLALTHYCLVNNQIRMLADLKGVAPEMPVQRLAFQFRDGSNLDRAHTQVMDRLAIVFEDSTHITQSWQWRDDAAPGGRDSAVYRYTRVR